MSGTAVLSMTSARSGAALAATVRPTRSQLLAHSALLVSEASKSAIDIIAARKAKRWRATR